MRARPNPFHVPSSFPHHARAPRIAGRIPATPSATWIFLLALGLAAVSDSALVPTAARSATILVPAEQPTIQGGIDAASPGDTVLVAAGTYSGNGNEEIDFGGRDIVLLAADGPEWTTIQGPDADPFTEPDPRAFVFGNGETGLAVVEGFTVRDFHILYPEVGPQGGGAIAIYGGATPTIRNCVFLDNSVIDGEGGAIHAEGGTFEDCVFTANYAAAWNTSAGGGAICCRDATLRNCWIGDNYAEEGQFGGSSGGGLFIGRNTLVEDCVIVENRATRGGGVHVSASGGGPLGTWIAGCTVASNSTYGGNGAQLSFASFTDAPNQNLYLERTILWSTGDCGTSDIDTFEEIAGTSRLNFICSLNDRDAVSGNVVMLYGPHCLDEAPLFCDPRACDGAPPFGEDYALQPESPCLPGSSPCGALIGAIDDACGVSVLHETPETPDTPNARSRVAVVGLQPNPARAAVTFHFRLEESSFVRAAIVDVSGREVAIVAQAEMSPGLHAGGWDLLDRTGRRVPAGAYYLEVEAGEVTRSARITVLP